MSKDFALDGCYQVTDTGCWQWVRSTDQAGYARIGARYMHREFYVERKGEIPAGLQIDHLCRNRACVNPDHLEAVTPSENIRRGWAFRQTNRCIRGHDLLQPGNTYRRKNGGRLCRPCARMRAARRVAS